MAPDKWQFQRENNTGALKSLIKSLGVDLAGVTDLKLLAGMPLGHSLDFNSFLKRYPYAIVLGAQLGKLRPDASGEEVSLFLHQAALEITFWLEDQGYRVLTIHPQDEYDLLRRIGLMSLKVLAKGAGLGWQGRSLLIVSPEYGPLHRLIAILTNMPLQADQPLQNQCGTCSRCVDKCPQNALTLTCFEDHPKEREAVLDISLCRGDDSCTVCLVVCPYQKTNL
jgi:epoxyqueuosine reductase QueG